MNIVKLLLSLVITWPIFSLILHLLVPQAKKRARHILQGALMITWLVLTIALLHFIRQPMAIMMGNWPAPFGIALVLDQLSCTVLVVFAITAACITFYSFQDQALIQKEQPFYAGFWLLLLGVCGSTFTADLFNLYVWFEVMLVSAFILLASSNQPKPGAMMHYALMNIIGTLFMLLAVSLIYALFGTLSYAAIAKELMQMKPQWNLPILCLLLFAIGLKGAVFPLYFWLPKAYPKPSTSATMLLSSLITKVVMIILLRLAWLWTPLHAAFLSQSLLWAAMATMMFGVLGAASQFRFKDILAFHIVSQLGYILLAIVLPLPMAIIAAVFFLIHNIFVKTNLFMVAGILKQHVGTDDFKKLGQTLHHHKWLSVTFFLSAMSLAGFPPLSGFWAKLLVIKAALEAHFYVSTSIAILVSLFTLYSMVKIWRYVFCEKAPVPQAQLKQPMRFSLSLTLGILPLVLLPLLMGLWPDSVLTWLKPIADQLQHPELYIHLALGEQA